MIKVRLSKMLFLTGALAVVLTGCGGAEEATPSTEVVKEVVAPITTPEKSAEPVRDLNGLVVTIASWADVKEPEVKANSYDEAVWEYRHEMMDKHNFGFEEKSLVKWNTALEEMSTTTLAGEPSAEIFRFHPSFIGQVIGSGLAADLSKSTVIDWSKPKWNDVAIQMATDDGAIYGLAVGFEPRKGVYFNKRLFEEAGLEPDLLYDLQASGEWTWEKFEELCEKLTRDIDNDGVNDIYAYAIQANQFAEIAILSNDGFYVGRDEDGTFYNNLDSPESIEALQWCVDLWQKDYDLFPAGEGNFATQNVLFQDGKVAMHVADEWEAMNYSKNMDDDFGFVCFPKGPKATQYAVGQSDELWVIPNSYTQKEIDDILFALDLWTDTPPDYDPNYAWMTSSYPLYRDVRAVDETNVLMREPGVQRVDYKNFLGSGKVDLNMGDKLYWNGATPVEVIEAMEGQMNAVLNELNAK